MNNDWDNIVTPWDKYPDRPLKKPVEDNYYSYKDYLIELEKSNQEIWEYYHPLN